MEANRRSAANRSYKDPAPPNHPDDHRNAATHHPLHPDHPTALSSTYLRYPMSRHLPLPILNVRRITSRSPPFNSDQKILTHPSGPIESRTGPQRTSYLTRHMPHPYHRNRRPESVPSKPSRRSPSTGKPTQGEAILQASPPLAMEGYQNAKSGSSTQADYELYQESMRALLTHDVSTARAPTDTRPIPNPFERARSAVQSTNRHLPSIRLSTDGPNQGFSNSGLEEYALSRGAQQDRKRNESQTMEVEIQRQRAEARYHQFRWAEHERRYQHQAQQVRAEQIEYHRALKQQRNEEYLRELAYGHRQILARTPDDRDTMIANPMLPRPIPTFPRTMAEYSRWIEHDRRMSASIAAGPEGRFTAMSKVPALAPDRPASALRSGISTDSPSVMQLPPSPVSTHVIDATDSRFSSPVVDQLRQVTKPPQTDLPIKSKQKPFSRVPQTGPSERGKTGGVNTENRGGIVAAPNQSFTDDSLQKHGGEDNSDPAKRRRIQVQVFVHAMPTRCRWGKCEAVLNSWGMLEKHILQAHIKYLSPELQTTRCSWGSCLKTFHDRERVHRHCQVEHMGEFCARCPFNCLFEGTTFPSLMAHVSRRHPTATPDDFVPGLIHFKPPLRTLPTLPEGEILIPHFPSLVESSQMITPIVTASARPRKNIKERTVQSSRVMSKADKKQRAKDGIEKKVAGRVIADVVKLATSTKKSRMSSSDRPRYSSPPDIRAILKSARVAVKRESATDNGHNPKSPSKSPLTIPQDLLDLLPDDKLDISVINADDAGIVSCTTDVDPWVKMGFSSAKIQKSSSYTTIHPDQTPG